VMGTGGAPEGVLTAAAMRCLGGEIYARLVVNSVAGRWGSLTSRGSIAPRIWRPARTSSLRPPA
jgi:fructose-1,6-bisphosphatase/sedoheptulose 1,7-bisphosphatase-like protein